MEGVCVLCNTVCTCTVFKIVRSGPRPASTLSDTIVPRGAGTVPVQQLRSQGNRTREMPAVDLNPTCWGIPLPKNQACSNTIVGVWAGPSPVQYLYGFCRNYTINILFSGCHTINILVLCFTIYCTEIPAEKGSLAGINPGIQRQNDRK